MLSHKNAHMTVGFLFQCIETYPQNTAPAQCSPFLQTKGWLNKHTDWRHLPSMDASRVSSRPHQLPNGCTDGFCQLVHVT